MDQFDDNEIGKLLRFKRHEQPPPGYFDDFLSEFHRRQRAELLRQPAWRVLLERVQEFILQPTLPSLTSYPVAAAAVLVCAAVLSLNVARSPQTSPSIAGTSTTLEQSVVPVSAVASVENEPAGWSLSRPVTTRALDAKSFRLPYPTAQMQGRVTATPRYVLDSTPVSYEAALRF